MKKGILTSLILKWNNISRLICLLLTVVIFSTGINVPAFAKNPASQTDLEAVETQEVTDEDTDNPGDTGDDSGDTKKDLNDLNPEADPASETTNQDPADSEKDLKEPEKEKTEENAQPESNPESELHSENIEPGSVKGPQKSTEPNPEEIADDKEQEKVPVDCTAVINDVINGTLQDASKPYRIRLTVKNTAPILLRANAEFAFTLRVTDEDSGHAFTYEGEEINPETGFYEIEDTRYFKGECDHFLEIESVDGKSTGSFQISILKPQKEDSDETNEQNDDEEDDDEEDDDEDDINQKDDEGTESEENQEDSEQNDDLKSEIPDLKETKQDNGLKSLSLFRKGLEQTEVSGEQKDGNTLSDAPQTRGGTYTVSIPESEYYTLTCHKLVTDSDPVQISNGDEVSSGDILRVTISHKENYSTDKGYLLESIKVDYSDPEGTSLFTDFTPNNGVYTCDITMGNSNVTISAVIKVQKTYTIEIEWKNESERIRHNDDLPKGIGVQTRKSSTNDSWINLDVLAEKKDFSDSEWTYTHTYYPDDPYDVRFVEIDSSGSRIDPDSQTIALFNVNVETDDEDPTPSRAFYEVSYTTPYGNDSLKTLITNTLSTSERTLKVNFTDEGNEEERPEKIKAVLQYKKSNGQWITIKQQDVSNSNNWKVTFSGVPKLASTSSNDPIRIRLVNDAGGLVYDHIGNEDADDPNPDDNDREAFFSSVQGVPGIELPVEECSVTYHDVDYIRTNSGASIPSYYPGRMLAKGNALRDSKGNGSGDEEQVKLGGQMVTLKIFTEIKWVNGNVIGEVPEPVTVQLQKQDQENGNWTEIRRQLFSNDDDWVYTFIIIVDQIAHDYRVREMDLNGNVLEQDQDGRFEITNYDHEKTQHPYTASYNIIPRNNPNRRSFEITNTRKEDDDNSYKVKIDFSDDFARRYSPDSITVKLQKKNGDNWADVQGGTKILYKNTNWEGSFDNVIIQEGQEYRVRELDFNGDIVDLNDYATYEYSGTRQMEYDSVVYNYNEPNRLTTIINGDARVEKFFKIKIAWTGDESLNIVSRASVRVKVQTKKKDNGDWNDAKIQSQYGSFGLITERENWEGELVLDDLYTKDDEFRIFEIESANNTTPIENNSSANMKIMLQNNENDTVKKYKVSYGDEVNGLTTITNTYDDDNKFEVKIVFDEVVEAAKQPGSIKAQLQKKDGNGKWNEVETITLNAAGNWSGSFATIVQDYKEDKYNYRVRELDINGATVVMVGDDDYNDQDNEKEAFLETANRRDIYYKTVTYQIEDVDEKTRRTTIQNNDALMERTYNVKIVWDDQQKQIEEKDNVGVILEEQNENGKWENVAIFEDLKFAKAPSWETQIVGMCKKDSVLRVREREHSERKFVDEDNSGYFNIKKDGNWKFVNYKVNYLGFDENSKTFTIQNTYANNEKNLTVKATWQDENNADRLREELMVFLYANDQILQHVRLNDNNNWTNQFTDLPEKDEQNQVFNYTIKVQQSQIITGEDGKRTYNVVYGEDQQDPNIKTITLTHTPKTEISGHIEWRETGKANAGSRPQNVTVQLRVGSTVRQRKQVSSPWNFTFDNLNKYENGNLIRYDIGEDNVDGYQIAKAGTTLINSRHEDEENNDNQQQQNQNPNGNNPGGGGGGAGAGGAAAAGIWKKIAIGIGIAAGIGAITGIIKGITDNGNSDTPSTARTSVSGQVKWANVSRDEDYPDHVTIRLLADGVPTDDIAYLQKENRGPDDWTFRFDNLYKVDQETGKKIQYSVRQDPLDNFKTEITTSDGKTIFTNTYQKNYTSMPVGIIWDDLDDNDGCRPESVTVTVSDHSAVLNEENDWNAIINGLPVGETLTPEISKTTVITGTDGPGTYKIDRPERNEGKEDIRAGEFFILRHTPETRQISGTVTWVDDNDRDGLRPEQVGLQLKCKLQGSGEVINLGSQYRATATVGNGWEFSFGSENDYPPKYYARKLIEYSVEEDAIENYDTSYSSSQTTENNVSITVTNSHAPEKTTVNGTITWEDENSSNRPETVEIHLLANGLELNPSKVVTIGADSANENGKWQFCFTDLWKNEKKDGKTTAIEYSITEEPISNYVTDIIGFDVTNSIIEKNYEISLMPDVDTDVVFTAQSTDGTISDTEKVYLNPVNPENQSQPYTFNTAAGSTLDMSTMNQATRDGYVLDGWYNQKNMRWTSQTTVNHEYCDPDISDESQSATIHSHKITLTARWKLRDAIIQYALPDGTTWKDGQHPAPVSIAQNGKAKIRITENAIQLNGKIFKGWQDKAGYLYQPGESFVYTNLNSVDQIGAGMDADGKPNPNVIILTAMIEDDPSSQQTETQGTLIFDSQGGTVIEPMTVTVNAPITEAEMKNWIESKTGKRQPVRASYIFAGWHTDPIDYAPVEYPITFSDAEKTKKIYAHWTPVNYILTFNPDGGPAVEKGNTQRLAYLTPLKNVDGPYVINETKKDEGHYTFTGWSPSLPEVMPAYNLEVKAVWEPTIYQITLILQKDENGVARSKTITGTYSSDINEKNPVRSDAVFIGWKKQKEYEYETDVWGLPSTMGDDNPTYEAQWRETPDAPEAEASDSTSIRITVLDGQEYSIDEGESWQVESFFLNLTPGKTYDVITRYAKIIGNPEKGIPEFPASKPSRPTSVTLKEEQEAPVPPMLKAGVHSIEVIAPKIKQEYKISNSNNELTDWVEPDQDGKVVFEGLDEDTLYTVQTRLKPTRKKNVSEPASASIFTRKITIKDVIINEPALVGRTLTATIVPADAKDVEYQWCRDGEPISGATGNKYTVIQDDREHMISVNATQHVYSTNEDTIIVRTAGWVPLAGEIQITLDNKDVLPIQLTEPADETILDIAEACHLGAKQAQLEGDKIELRVVIRKLNEADISAADRKAIQDAMTAKAANAEVLSYMDITVWLVIGDYEKQITNLGNHSLTLTLTVPEKDRKQNRIFLIAQAHDNKGSILSMSEENSIPFTSALFSTYALGALDKVTITFDTDGGNNIEPITQLFGTEVTPPEDPTKEGNDFIRWDPEIPKVMPEKDLTVKAIWQPRIYYIILKLDNDTARGIRIEKAYGTKINVADPANEGDLVFIGWKKENGSGEEDWGLPTHMEDDNPTYTAQWLGKPEAVADGDTAIRVTVEAGKEYSIDEGESWGIPEGGIYSGLDKGIYKVITRYQATGTREASIASQPTIVILGPEETKVLRSPSLKSDRFSVEVSGPISAQKYSIDNGSTWKIPDENGQVIFTGLDEDKLYTVQTTWANSQTQDEAEILSASIYTKKLLIEEVKITGKALFSRTLTASCEPEGAKVDEWQWYHDGTAIDGATGNEYTITEADCEHTLSVKATQRVNRINEYNIIVKEAGRVPQPGKIQIILENSDKLPVRLTIPENGKILNIAEAKHSGAKEAQLQGSNIELRVVIRKLDEADVSTGDRKVIQEVLKANADDIRILSYMDITVWLIIDDKEAEKEQITDLGEYPLTLKMNVPEKERRTGRYFFIARAHNNKGSILTKSKEDSIPFTSALFSTFALGVSDLITITFDTDGGSEIAPIMQKYGTAVTKPANPTKEGYSFTGWDPEIPETMPAEDLMIKAKWKINRYTITFDTDGGNKITPITLDYGTAVTKPANPTKEGHTFTGWDPAIPETMPAEDLTVKAKWKINRYTISFDTDGGNKINPITLDYGTTITKPANPTKSGYTFMGWSPEIPDKMPARNLTVKAQWKQADNKSVNTGDDSNMTLWIALLVLLVAGLAGFNIYQMKKRRKNH